MIITSYFYIAIIQYHIRNMHQPSILVRLLAILCVLPLAFTALLPPEIRAESIPLLPPDTPLPDRTVQAGLVANRTLEKRAFHSPSKLPHPGQEWDGRGAQPFCAIEGARDDEAYIGAARSILEAFKRDYMWIDPTSVFHGNRKFVCKQTGPGLNWGVGKGFPAICMVTRDLPKEFEYSYWQVVDAAERLINAGVRACGAIAINSGHTRDGQLAFRYTWEKNCWRQSWSSPVNAYGWADPFQALNWPRYNHYHNTEMYKLAFCTKEYKQHGNLPGQGNDKQHGPNPKIG